MVALTHDLLSLLWTYLLPACRGLGAMLLLPGVSGLTVPPQVRLLLAAGVGATVASAVGPSRAVPQEEAAVLLAALSELGLGLIIGWAACLFVETVRWSGEVLDMQLGLQVGRLFDPVTMQSGSLLGQMYYMTTLTFFLVIDGHHWVLWGLLRSFEALPIGCVTLRPALTAVMVDAAGSALDIAIRVAVPGLAALLLADVALALVARSVPQMNVFLVGMPAKIAIGLVVLAFSAPAAVKVLTELVERARDLVWLIGGG